MVIRLLLAVLVVAVLLLSRHYAPLQPAVTAVYAGLVLGAIGIVSLVRPIRALWIRSRGRAVIVTLCGVAVVASGLMWPASTHHAEGPRQRLDDFMTSYEFHEYHEARVHASADRVARAVRTVRLADMPMAVVLMRIRALGSGRIDAAPPDQKPLLDLFAASGTGFLPLAPSAPGEYVGGMVGRPWTSGRPPRVATPAEFMAFSTPGFVKVAFNIRWTDEGGGWTRVTTETRISGTDAEARRTFARYWRIIYPGSAIIRRVWLDAIVRLAERP